MTASATATATAGGTIQDTATLSGGTSPTGTISFSIYGPNDATCSSTATSDVSATVSGNGSYSSSAVTENVAGTYRWIASYSGDANNNGFTTQCNEAGETSTVNKASPAMTTSATATATAGGTIQDTATLSGGTSPTGTISFSIYGPNDATCSSTATSAGSATVTGNGTYSSSAVTENVAGTYRWIASYSGDANNNSFTTACNDPGETSAVNKPLHKGKMTGGGQILVNKQNKNDKRSFGFNAKETIIGASGHFNYLNHVTGFQINGEVTKIIYAFPTISPPGGQMQFEVTNAASDRCKYLVTAKDQVEPG